MRHLIAGLVLLLLVAPAPAESPAGKMLGRLRGLEGEWSGTLEWSGARTVSGTASAKYRLTGAGSAVVEDLFMNGQATASMSSVYHLDGADLRMTHYCAARNQPRLKASEIDEKNGIVRFAFVDATGLQDQPAHVHAAELRLVSEDELVIRFTFDNAGAKSVEHIVLKRVRR